MCSDIAPTRCAQRTLHATYELYRRVRHAHRWRSINYGVSVLRSSGRTWPSHSGQSR